jgi:hypothetical protein
MRFLLITFATLVALSFAPAVAAPCLTPEVSPGFGAAQKPPAGNEAAQTTALPAITPPRTTTSTEKIERLKLAGVFATVAQLGSSYRLDMLTPATSSGTNPRGFLKH